MFLRSFFAKITELSLRFKWLTIGLTVLFLVLGVVGAAQLKQELLPNIEFPQTFIVTFRPGANNEDLLNLVTIPLEQELAKIPGIIPEGLQSTTGAQGAPVAFITVRSNFGIPQAGIRQQINEAIERVTADGVPLGLSTTADLTPEIVTHVLNKAPSMFKHFEGRHLLAMSPDVLKAALAVNPDFVNDINVLTRDALAAERVNAALGGAPTEREPVRLPQAWRVGVEDANGNPQGLPRLLSFDLTSDIPVVSASVFDASGSLTPDELRALVNDRIVPAIRAVDGVANVAVGGGQEIPADVMAAAAEQAAALRGGGNSEQPEATATPQPTPAPGASTNGGAQAESAPRLPEAWRVIRVLVLQQPNPLPDQLREQYGITAKFDNADDLLSAIDGDGNTVSAAELFNQIVTLNAPLVRLSTPPEVLDYVREREPGFTQALDDAALEALADVPLQSGAWSQLAAQPALQSKGFATMRDLAALGDGGGAAEALNNIVDNTPAAFSSFAVRLVDGLTPEAVRLLENVEPGFLNALKPDVLRALSASTLRSLPELIDSLSDEALKADLQAIAEGTTPSAAETLSGGVVETLPDDPNAPELPAMWKAAPGLSLNTAQDFLRKPYGLSAGAFLNAAANSPQGGAAMVALLTPDILGYIQANDPTFYETLQDTTLAMLTPETLAELPADVQARLGNGTVFRPTERVSRADRQASMILTVNKEREANTVQVFHAVDNVFKAIEEENPNVQVAVIFEQASFIEESISGVAREGGLGAIMAVVVILLFLNFSIRSTLVTAVSIPTSVAIAFVLMRWVPESLNSLMMQPGVKEAMPAFLFDFLTRLFPGSISLNIMTLSGLTVAIGRVVDDSIVVLENTYRQLQSGVPRREAVLKGTRDVSLAIFSATLTTIVVFLPIGLTGGIVGEFFLPFGMAVSYALGASFVVAITVVPLLAYLFIDPKHLPEEKEGRLESIYQRALGWALNNRLAVLAIATITLVIGLYIFTHLPTTFLPAVGEPQINVTVEMPEGTPMAVTDALAREMEDYVDTFRDKGVKRYQTVIGSGGQFSDLAAFLGGGASISESQASITALVDPSQGDLAAMTIQWRAKASEIFGSENVTVSRASLSEQGFGGFAVVVSGPKDVLMEYDPIIAETLSGVPGLTNVTSSANLVGDAPSYLRVGQTDAIQYSAELEATDTLGVTADAVAAVEAIPNLPPSLTVSQGFQSQMQTEGFSQTFSAMGVAIVAVYVVMVFTFGSLVHPFTILFSLPLAVVGAAVGLWLTNRVVGISALVGLLMLVGIVVTNAIVMIDRVQQNRRERGLPPREALLEGARTRLRPILMTAIATMFALLPLAIGLSQGTIIAAELGTVVIGGLFSSTLLTLLVVPIVYSIFDALQRRVTGEKDRAKTAAAPTGD